MFFWLNIEYFAKNKNIIIWKVDKGKTALILDKYSYICAIEEVINDNAKSANLDIPTGTEINHIINLEKRIPSGLKYKN